MPAVKVQASLRIHAVSPEPPLLAHTSSESRGTFRQKARSLAPLNGWACTVTICHDGMLEDTNLLDGAHLMLKPQQNTKFLWVRMARSFISWYMYGSGTYYLDFVLVFMPRHQKVAGYYVIPSEILSVRPSVRPSVSAHHHSCIGNSSYSFRPILLKLYRCFKDGLKICILFFQNPEIIFYHFFPIFNLDIFRALILQICIWSMYLVSATPPTVFGESFWNFTGVLRMVWRYAYCFFRILKLFFITFFAFLT